LDDGDRAKGNDYGKYARKPTAPTYRIVRPVTGGNVNTLRLERFGKASVVLARCGGDSGNPTTDQSMFELIFRAASSIMERYRDALGARKMVPQELARLGVRSAAKTTTTKAEAGHKKKP